MAEAKKGRPSKKENELRKENSELKKEIERSKEIADNNLKYAKQATVDLDKVQTEAFTKGHQTKAIIETASDALDMIDAISRLTRKALERDLTKDFSSEARNQVKKNQKGE